VRDQGRRRAARGALFEVYKLEAGRGGNSQSQTPLSESKACEEDLFGHFIEPKRWP
jgi:hypothetical protein